MRSPRYAVLLALCGCLRGSNPDAPDGLDGFKASLLRSPHLTVRVEAEVEGVSAIALFDVSAPLSTISAGCFAESGPPSSRGTVRAPRPSGGFVELPEVHLDRSRIGAHRLGRLKVGVREKEPGCLLILGGDVLEGFALRIDPLRREVALSRSRSREAYQKELDAHPASAPDELFVVPIARHPTAGWPLLSVRVRRAERALTGAFVFSTQEGITNVSAQALRESGVEPQIDPHLPLPKDLSAAVPRLFGAGIPYQADDLELSPGLSAGPLTLRADPKWENPSAVGVLGSDAWGRFVTIIDLEAERLVLRRPRVTSVGQRQGCPAPDGSDRSKEEHCYQLHVRREGAHGLTASAAVWRDLPEGGRLYLDTLGDDGKPLGGQCRLGFSFASTARGASTAYPLPWPGLEKTLPACFEQFRRTRAVALSLFEEGAAPECAGHCAFAQHLATGRLSCECPSGTAVAELQRRFFEMYRRMIDKLPPPRVPEEPEPEDPSEP